MTLKPLCSLSSVLVSLYWHKRHGCGKQWPSRVSILSLSLLIFQAWNEHKSSTSPSPKTSLLFFPPSWDRSSLTPYNLLICNPASSNMHLAADFANASKSCDTEQEWQSKQKKIIILIFFHISVTLKKYVLHISLYH